MNNLKKAFALILAITLLGACKKNGEVLLDPPAPEQEKKQQAPASATFSAVSKRINASFGGYYLLLPPNYSNSKKYPVLIFFHGLGQRGNGNSDLPKLGEDGIGKLMKEKRIPPGFTVKGKTHQMIIIAPQYEGSPDVADARSVLNFVRKNFSIDPSRIYISGLSAGGMLLSELVAAEPKTFAAAIPIAGVSNHELRKKTSAIASARLPLWIFHNAEDPMVSSSLSINFYDALLALKMQPEPRLTIFKTAGHDAWSSALNPAYKENGSNIYEWLLQFSR